MYLPPFYPSSEGGALYASVMATKYRFHHRIYFLLAQSVALAPLAAFALVAWLILWQTAIGRRRICRRWVGRRRIGRRRLI